MCGRFEGERRALHHIEYGGDYQGVGGRRRHALDNLVTVAWLGDNDCHRIVHANKGLWVPILQQLVATTGVTGLQLLRWQPARKRGAP